MVEDYTDAFLVAMFCLVFLALFAIWAVWGLVAAIGTGWITNAVLGRFRRDG